tara:strand:+ start:1057 stop:1263 length:207 start_codon:yes stop_codon:yes gene_type:complete
MGVLSDAAKVPKEKKQDIQEKDFSLTAKEVGFLLAKLADLEFKGVEIEFTYNLILKLQEHYKYLSQDK